MTEEFVTADVVQLNDKQYEMKLKAGLHRKLQNARVAFKDKHVEARGRNDFNHFDYITLKDIVTEAIPILLENDLSIHHKFYLSPPRVELVDLETGYSEDFGSNFDGLVDEKTHNQRLQALGSTESYLRRYIYLQILDIVEGDPDKDFGREDAKPRKQNSRYAEQNKNIIDESRTSGLAREVDEELARQGKSNPSHRDRWELANKWFTDKKINRDELRALRKNWGGSA